jgi:uncharacterized protein YpbB
LIIKDYIPKPHKKEKIEEIDEKEEKQIKAIREEFDAIMSYNIEDAIKEKRGE